MAVVLQQVGIGEVPVETQPPEAQAREADVEGLKEERAVVFQIP